MGGADGAAVVRTRGDLREQRRLVHDRHGRQTTKGRVVAELTVDVVAPAVRLVRDGDRARMVVPGADLDEGVRSCDRSGDGSAWSAAAGS